LTSPSLVGLKRKRMFSGIDATPFGGVSGATDRTNERRHVRISGALYSYAVY